MRKRTVFASVFVLAGCGPGSAPTGPTVVDSGIYHHFATTSITLPRDAAEQAALGLNIDGDPSGKPDNKLGHVFVILGENGVSLQAANDDAISTGDLVMLHSVRADDLVADSSVSWRTLGADMSGGDTLLGGINDQKFSGGGGSILLEVAVSTEQPVLQLPLIAAKIEATVNEQTCSGKLGGAMTSEDIDASLLPTVVNMFNFAIERDCPNGECVPDSSGELISGVFDTNGDGVVTLDELRESSILQSLIAPDVDLFGEDGVADAVSVGVGFTCDAADFVVPGENP